MRGCGMTHERMNCVGDRSVEAVVTRALFTPLTVYIIFGVNFRYIAEIKKSEGDLKEGLSS